MDSYYTMVKTIDKYWKHCLGHLKLFYNWYNDLILYNTEEKRINEIKEKIREFVVVTKVDDMLNDKMVEDKNKAILIRNSRDLVFITINDFLREFNIECDLRPNKLIKDLGGRIV